MTRSVTIYLPSQTAIYLSRLSGSPGGTLMNRKIPLWPDAIAPYTEFSPDQDQPSLAEYACPGAKCAMVVCPGGGYHFKAPHEGGPVAEMLANNGVSAYVLDYRVAPCHYEAPLADALRAIRVVRAMGYDQVGILGFSAGGHLTCSAATQYDLGNPDAPDPIDRISSRPDVFVPCYPVVSLAAYRHQGSLENLLGAECNNYALIRRFSSELHVNSDTPPAFIWHTSNDASVPVEESVMLAMALSGAMVPYELHIFPEGPHGMGLAEDDPIVGQWPDLLCKWLHSRGF